MFSNLFPIVNFKNLKCDVCYIEPNKFILFPSTTDKITTTLFCIHSWRIWTITQICIQVKFLLTEKWQNRVDQCMLEEYLGHIVTTIGKRLTYWTSCNFPTTSTRTFNEYSSFDQAIRQKLLTHIYILPNIVHAFIEC